AEISPDWTFREVSESVDMGWKGSIGALHEVGAAGEALHEVGAACRGLTRSWCGLPRPYMRLVRLAEAYMRLVRTAMPYMKLVRTAGLFSAWCDERRDVGEHPVVLQDQPPTR